MKPDNIEKFITSLSAVKMTEDEKALMRRDLLAFSYASIPSPYAPRFVMIKRTFAFALVLLLTVGSLSKPASAKALPGEFLYPVKMMHEEIEAVTKNTPEAKIDHEIKRTQKRIEEATELAGKKGLNSENQVKIAQNIKKHTAKVKKEIQEVKKADPVKALELNVQLETTLKSNTEVLKKAIDDEEKNLIETPEEEPMVDEVVDGDPETPEEEVIETPELPVINELDIALDAEEEVVIEEEEDTDLIFNALEEDIKEVEAVSKEVQDEVVDRVIKPAEDDTKVELEVKADLQLKR